MTTQPLIIAKTYTIKDVSEKTGLSIYALRFYDKEGLLPFVARSKSGIRIFTETDIYLIETICYLKDTGMPVKDIKKYVDYVMEGPASIPARRKLFLAHRKDVSDKIEALTKNLAQIDQKLDIYTSPDADAIIREHIRVVNEEKKSLNLKSQFSPLDLP